MGDRYFSSGESGKEMIRMEYSARVCDRLPQVRNVFRLSQRGLAKRVGVTSQLISMIESGKTDLNYRVAKLIEHEFGVRAEWLMNGEGEMMVHKDEKRPAQLDLVLNSFPEIAKTLNEFAGKLTIEDWYALNSICSRINHSGEIESEAS